MEMKGIWYSISNSSQFVSIVDDEPDIANLFKDVLSAIHGFEVHAFTEPSLALEHFQNNSKNYVCVISDFRMPLMNGAQLLDRMKIINPEVKGILMTAFNVHDDFFESHNFDKFLSKPIKMNDLILTVQELVNKYETPANPR